MAEVDASIPGRDQILERILVAVGGSEPSFVALEYALDLAEASNTGLRIPRVAEPVFAQIVPVLERQARASGEQVEEQIASAATGRSVEFEMEATDGRVASCIIEHAGDATLIVIGKVGHREDHGGLLGTNTERIVRRTGRPVLLTPSKHAPIQHVVLAFGAEDIGSNLPVVASNLAGALCADVSVVTVAEARNAAERTWAEIPWAVRAREETYTFHHETGPVAAGNPRHGSHKSLLAMGAYHHSPLYHLALGSVTEEVISKFPGPVLLLR